MSRLLRHSPAPTIPTFGRYWASTCRSLTSDTQSVTSAGGRGSTSWSATDASFDVVTSIFMFHELPPEVRRTVFGECVRVLKPGGRLVLVDSLQRGDEPDYEGLLDLFPQNYHEPYYASYTTEDFGEIARVRGLTHVREVKAFVSKVMVFDKPVAA